MGAPLQLAYFLLLLFQLSVQKPESLLVNCHLLLLSPQTSPQPFN